MRRDDTGSGTAHYLRSSALGGQAAAELRYLNVNGSWQWALQRGYVYSGGGLLAMHQGNGVYFVHEDPVTKGRG